MYTRCECGKSQSAHLNNRWPRGRQGPFANGGRRQQQEQLTTHWLAAGAAGTATAAAAIRTATATAATKSTWVPTYTAKPGSSCRRCATAAIIRHLLRREQRESREGRERERESFVFQQVSVCTTQREMNQVLKTAHRVQEVGHTRAREREREIVNCCRVREKQTKEKCAEIGVFELDRCLCRV